MAVADLDVLDRELLIADPHAELATVEGLEDPEGTISVPASLLLYPDIAYQVGHISPGPVFHPDTLMRRVAVLVQDELDVDQRGGLGNLPVDPGGRGSGGHLGGIDLEVTDRFEEVLYHHKCS